MPFFNLIFVCLLLLTQSVSALTNDELLSPELAFKISAKAVSVDQLEITWDIADGYYLYRDKMKFISKTDAIQSVTPNFPEGKTKHDENFGDMVVYHNKLTIPLSLSQSEASSIQLLVQYQGCADRGVCYPPQKKTFELALPVANINPAEQVDALFKPKTTQADLLPAEQAFRFFAVVNDTGALKVTWEIAPGYYLYREKIRLELSSIAGSRLGDYTIPRGTAIHDEAFGQVEIFHEQLSFELPLLRSQATAQTVTLLANFQGCADRGVCYPPMSQKIDLELPAAPINDAVITPKLSEQDQIVSSLKQDSLAMTLLSFFGFGLLLSLTPCIFPMIPILSGIIVGHGNHITTSRAFLLSLCYVIASALTYTLFGILAALFGGNLQATFQQPWIIGLFSGIFVLLSLSMFGFYELEIPNSLKTKLHNSSVRHRDGSLWGVAIMGALSSLIVGPCVAAPLAGALIYIGQTGNAVLGGSALFAMGMGMGMPLLLLGASAGKILPKAGSWLYATKAVFGVIMLAVAVWMMSRILPATIIMLLWAMLLILPAIYLKAIDPLPEQCSGWQKLWKGLGLMMLAYGLLLLIGFSMGNNNPLKPLQGMGVNNVQAAEQGLNFKRVASLAALETEIQQANARHQIVMLDFYADWCISCKEMEAYTFTDAKVKQALAGVVLLQADVTNNNADDQALLAKFNLIGPPAILFFGADGKESPQHRVIGFQDAETFTQTVQQVKL
ncbi:MAG: protein-disulfide reductase DsbD [Methylococcales bacterium]|nr:MAG: protein-disulfide reductase DsbD [Methylococcales bacterium]